MTGDQGLDRLFGEAGNDTLNGGLDNDGLFGGSGDDLLIGGSGHDRLFGGLGNDQINNGSGDDTVYGNAGFDRIMGAAGNDLLYGGFNADHFEFLGDWGHDTIGDFDALNDAERIGFYDNGTATGNGITDFADLLANHMVQQGGDVLITDARGNTVTLTGIDLSDLHNEDFVFL